MSGAFHRTASDQLLLNFRVQRDGTLGFDIFGSKVIEINYFHTVHPATPPINLNFKKKVKISKISKKVHEEKKIDCIDVYDEKVIDMNDPQCDFKFTASGQCGYSKIKCKSCQRNWPNYGTKGYKPKYCKKCAVRVNAKFGTNYTYLCRTYAWDTNLKRHQEN